MSENRLAELGLLADFGVPVQMRGKDRFEVGGFYKSGGVVVDLQKGTIAARYEEITQIDPEESLVKTLSRLNKKWYERSKNLLEDWALPEPAWAEVDQINQSA